MTLAATNLTTESFKDFEHRRWHEAATTYDETFGRLTASTCLKILGALEIRSGQRFLDIACGGGQLAALAATRGADCVGVDFSQAMVDLARRKNSGVKFDIGDAEKLSQPDSSFDCAAMNFGILHLSEPERALSEAFRVLKPGGRFATTVWQTPDIAIGFGIILDAVRQHGDMNVNLPAGPDFFRFSDPRLLEDALRNAGFQNVRVELLYLKWRVSAPDKFFDAFLKGSARTGALLAEQHPAALQKIREQVFNELMGVNAPSGVIVPMPALLASGTRPTA